jgi:parallel beta-helix repeat protein
MRVLTAIAFCGLISALPASAAEIHVSRSAPTGGNGSLARPFNAIAAGLKIAGPGDTVIVGEGVYAEIVTTVRSGTAEKPILLRAEGAVSIKSPKPMRGRLVNIYHDHIAMTGFTLRDADILLWMFGTRGVVISNNRFQNAGGECIRIRYQASYNRITDNTVTGCGATGFDLAGTKNGEGIYIGTAPEQLAKNAAERVPANAPLGLPTNLPDRSHDNLIAFNTIVAPAECVDMKEYSHDNVVSANTCRGNLDPESAGISSRGTANAIVENAIIGPIAGAGIRIGGDTVDHGRDNIVRGNDIRDVAGHGIKDVNPAQRMICENRLTRIAGRASASGRAPSAPCPAELASTPVLAAAIR